MCNYLRSARAYSVLYTALLVLCFQFTMVGDSNAQVLACNNAVQISMNADCDAIITPDMILEGAYPGTDADYLMAVPGNSGNPLTISTLGTYQVTITYIPTGNNCWSDVKIEDKLAPVITAVGCGSGGSNFGASFTAANVAGAATPLTTFGTECAAFSAGFPGGVIPVSTAGFVISSIPVTLAGGTYTFTPEASTTADCSTIFYLIPAGTFDINEPCANAIAVGGVSAVTGVIIPGTDFVPSGDYELLVCQGNMNTPCAFTINMNSDVCQLPCSAYDALLAGDIVTQPAVDENCGTYNCYYTDSATPVMCGTSVIERTWICEDSNGNISAPYVQSYAFAPVDLSEITPPNPDVDLNCGVDAEPESIYNYFDPNGLGLASAYMNAWPTLYGLPLSEALVCNLAITKTDQVVPACGASCTENNKVFRTWTIYDWCAGTSISYGQVIKALDTEDPTIVIDADDITISVDPWGCFGTLNLPSPDILHDNCDNGVTYTVSAGIGIEITNNVATGMPLGKHTLVYTATDCCGNSSTEELVVTVEDLTAPVAVAVQNLVVSLTAGSNNGIAKMFAQSVDNGSHDGCGPVFLEIRRDADACGFVGNTTYNNNGDSFDAANDPDDGAFVKFCCEDISGSNGVDDDGDGINDYGLVQVWLRVWDYNGNFNETWANVRVENKLAPSLICPAFVTINCDASIHPDNTGYATAINSCGNVPVSYIDSATLLDDCGVGTINRRWFVVGNSSKGCTQLITKSAGVLFNGGLINFPQDIDTDCANLGYTGIPTWSSGACDLVAYSIKSDTFQFQAGVCLKILNEFTVIDWCQYDPNVAGSPGKWEHTQVIKVNDNDAPTFPTCDNQVFGADDQDDLDGDGNTCEGRNIIVTNSATDGGFCSSYSLNWEIDVDLWGDGTVDYVYSSSYPQGHPYYVPPTLNGQTVAINLPDIDASMNNHTILWRALDGCGNIGSCLTNFMVTDIVKPTPYCVSLSTALMQSGTVDLWACDFDLGAFDNCTDQDDLRFTFTSNSPDTDPNYIPSLRCSSKTFNCSDFVNSPNGVVDLQVYVWDEKDNFEFCNVQLTLVDNQGACSSTATGMNIAGRVATEDGLEVEDVSVQLNSDNILGFPLSDMSSLSGGYSFYNNPAHLDYELEGVKDGDDMNGVSTLDLVLIQKHILGIRMLNSPYKVVAADINHDQNVTAVDLVELRKLILGIYSELPSNNSWRFVEESQTFTDANSPWPVNELIDINDLDADLMTEDFVAVKIGDVNSSATVNFDGGAISSRGNDQVDFIVADQNFSAGDMVQVDFRASDFVNVSGYQMTLRLDGLALVDLKAGAINITNQNFALIDGAVSFSWNEAEAVTINTNEILFTATFEAENKGRLSNSLSISDQLTTSEIYLEEGALIEGLGLEFRDEAGITTQNYELLQNEPNPFKASTLIGFRLPNAAQATISLYDVTGKLVKNITADYAKGYNQVVIDRADIPATGVIYYQLESGSFTASKKMIIVD